MVRILLNNNLIGIKKGNKKRCRIFHINKIEEKERYTRNVYNKYYKMHVTDRSDNKKFDDETEFK